MFRPLTLNLKKRQQTFWIYVFDHKIKTYQNIKNCVLTINSCVVKVEQSQVSLSDWFQFESALCSLSSFVVSELPETFCWKRCWKLTNVWIRPLSPHTPVFLLKVSVSCWKWSLLVCWRRKFTSLNLVFVNGMKRTPETSELLAPSDTTEGFWVMEFSTCSFLLLPLGVTRVSQCRHQTCLQYNYWCVHVFICKVSKAVR